MGNRSRAVLVAGGVFCIGIAALSRFYAAPALSVAPTDQFTQVIADTDPVQHAKVFDTKTLSEITTDLEAVRTVKAYPELSKQASKDLDRKVVVYEMSIVTDKPGYVMPDDKTQTDKLPRSFSLQRMVLDATTGEAVSWQPKNADDGEYLSTAIDAAERDYADDKESGEGRPNFEGHKGLVLKFPFGTKKKTYDFWEANTRKAWPSKYVSEEKLDGLKVYKFVQEVPTTKISEIEGVPRATLKLTGTGGVTVDRDYKSTRTFWVEPVTGAIIKAADQQYSTLQYEGESRAIATDATFTYTDDTVKKNVSGGKEPDGREGGDYKAKAAQLSLLENTVPLITLILGILLIALAGFLQTRPAPARRRSTS